jgi:non-specific serine/threonine protein kinase
MPFFYALETQFCAMMDDLLALGSGETQEMRVSAISMLGWTRIVLGDRVRGLAHLEECERIIGDVALSDTPPPVLFLRGIYLVLSHADPAGLGLLAVACEGFRAVGAEGDVQMVLLIRALSAGLMGPAELADAVSEKCLEHAQQQNASWAMTWALWTLGLPARTHSLDVLRESLAKQIELGDHWGTTWGVEAEAWRRAAIGDHVVAARLLGGSISLQQRHGVQISGLVPFAKQRELTQARIIAGIGKDHFEHAYQAGEGLTTNEVFKLALGEGDDPEDSLSPRRLLIAQLVAQGKRNWEIAALTGVQQRTVEANLSHIFKVVNVENREQLTKWYHDKYGQSEED